MSLMLWRSVWKSRGNLPTFKQSRAEVDKRVAFHMLLNIGEDTGFEGGLGSSPQFHTYYYYYSL
jgi:hypothetical protein